MRTVSKMQIRSSLEIEDFQDLAKLAEDANQTIPDYLRPIIVKHLNEQVKNENKKEKPAKKTRSRKKK